MAPEKASPGSRDTLYQRNQDAKTVRLWLLSLNADKTLGRPSRLGCISMEPLLTPQVPAPTTGVVAQGSEGNSNSVTLPWHELDSDTGWGGRRGSAAQALKTH